jgi:hypothetical protein
VFESHSDQVVATVAANAIIPGRNPRTGQPEMEVVASVLVDRDDWTSIDAMHIDPLACLRGLSAKFGERWKSR